MKFSQLMKVFFPNISWRCPSLFSGSTSSSLGGVTVVWKYASYWFHICKSGKPKAWRIFLHEIARVKYWILRLELLTTGLTVIHGIWLLKLRSMLHANLETFVARKTGVSCLGVTFQKAALGPQKAQVILETTIVTSFVVHLIVQAILPLKAVLTDAVILWMQNIFQNCILRWWNNWCTGRCLLLVVCRERFW